MIIFVCLFAVATKLYDSCDSNEQCLATIRCSKCSEEGICVCTDGFHDVNYVSISNNALVLYLNFWWENLRLFTKVTVNVFLFFLFLFFSTFIFSFLRCAALSYYYNFYRAHFGPFFDMKNFKTIV